MSQSIIRTRGGRARPNQFFERTGDPSAAAPSQAAAGGGGSSITAATRSVRDIIAGGGGDSAYDRGYDPNMAGTLTSEQAVEAIQRVMDVDYQTALSLLGGIVGAGAGVPGLGTLGSAVGRAIDVRNENDKLANEGITDNRPVGFAGLPGSTFTGNGAPGGSWFSSARAQRGAIDNLISNTEMRDRKDVGGGTPVDDNANPAYGGKGEPIQQNGISVENPGVGVRAGLGLAEQVAPPTPVEGVTSEALPDNTAAPVEQTVTTPTETTDYGYGQDNGGGGGGYDAGNSPGGEAGQSSSGVGDGGASAGGWYRHGGQIPGNGDGVSGPVPITAHEGEIVLPPELSVALLTALGRGDANLGKQVLDQIMARVTGQAPNNMGGPAAMEMPMDQEPMPSPMRGPGPGAFKPPMPAGRAPMPMPAPGRQPPSALRAIEAGAAPERGAPTGRRGQMAGTRPLPTRIGKGG